MLKSNNFIKKTPQFFSFDFGDFFQNRHEEQRLANSSKQIKEVKQMPQRRGGSTRLAMKL